MLAGGFMTEIKKKIKNGLLLNISIIIVLAVITAIMK